MRETALHRLRQDAIALLLASNSQQANQPPVKRVIETCANIVSHCSADPVYKVFVASLVSSGITFSSCLSVSLSVISIYFQTIKCNIVPRRITTKSNLRPQDCNRPQTKVRSG